MTGSVRAAEERQQHGVVRRLLLEELMDDQVVIPDNGVHKAHLRGDFRYVLAAPGKTKGVLDVAFDFHDP